MIKTQKDIYEIQIYIYIKLYPKDNCNLNWLILQ